MQTVEQIVADTLAIAVDRVTDDLEYNAIPEWDSLNHVNLMTALEQRFGAEIDEDLMVELTSIRAIKAFAARRGGGQ